MSRHAGTLLKLFILAMFGLTYAFVALLGRGELNVLAPTESDLTVVIDGQASVVKKNQRERFSLARGPRAITLTTAQGQVDHAIEVVDGYSRFLIAAPNQCFVLLDISGSYRPEGASGPPPLPALVLRVYSGERYSLQGNEFLPGHDPPTIGRQGAKVVLVRELDCRFFGPGVSEREIFAVLGLL